MDATLTLNKISVLYRKLIPAEISPKLLVVQSKRLPQVNLKLHMGFLIGYLLKI